MITTKVTPTFRNFIRHKCSNTYLSIKKIFTRFFALFHASEFQYIMLCPNYSDPSKPYVHQYAFVALIGDPLKQW